MKSFGLKMGNWLGAAPMRFRGWFLTIIVLAAGVWLGVRASNPGPPSGVYPDTARTSIGARGVLEGTAPSSRLGFDRDGRIGKVLVQVGALVEAGQVLAELECAGEAARVLRLQNERRGAVAQAADVRVGERAEAELVASSALQLAKARLRQAEIRSSRYEQLLQLGPVVAAGEADDARAAVQTALKDVELAQANSRLAISPGKREAQEHALALLDAASAAVDEAASELERCALKSPAAGTVLYRDAEVGDIVSTLAPRTLFEVADQRVWHARVEIDEDSSSGVHLGQPVRVILGSPRGAAMNGEIVEIDGMLSRRISRSPQAQAKLDRKVRQALVRIEKCVAGCLVGREVDVVLTGARAN